jgi:UDP-N-acetylmuramate--alanine ligase
MLAELMRFKSCVASPARTGKTTTTSLVATLLDAGGLDPTVINGGIINAYGTNARMGAATGWWSEADGIRRPRPEAAGRRRDRDNIGPEHLDHFGSFDAIKDAFRSFIDNIPFYGFARDVHRSPDRAGPRSGRIEDRRVITYGENPQADVRLSTSTPRVASTASGCSSVIRRPGFRIGARTSSFPMPWHPQRPNATAAIAVRALNSACRPDAIRNALRRSAA